MSTDDHTPGDVPSINEWLRQLYTWSRRLANHFISDPETAKDALHDTYRDVLSKFRCGTLSVNSLAELRYRMYAEIHRVCRNHVRSMQRNIDRLNPLSGREAGRDQLFALDIVHLLPSIILEMKPELAFVFLEVNYFQKSVAEVAEESQGHLTERTARNWLYRADQEVQEAINAKKRKLGLGPGKGRPNSISGPYKEKVSEQLRKVGKGLKNV